jgi:hypothetical protein
VFDRHHRALAGQEHEPVEIAIDHRRHGEGRLHLASRGEHFEDQRLVTAGEKDAAVAPPHECAAAGEAQRNIRDRRRLAAIEGHAPQAPSRNPRHFGAVRRPARERRVLGASQLAFVGLREAADAQQPRARNEHVAAIRRDRRIQYRKIDVVGSRHDLELTHGHRWGS